MTTADDDVDALVLAAGRGERLGLGPKAWLVLGGRTLLERAVATMRAVSTRVIVGVSPSDVARAAAAVGADTTVLPGGTSRRETMAAAFRAGRAPVVLVHDVAHPFVTPALAREVIALARRGGGRRALDLLRVPREERRGANAPRCRRSLADPAAVRVSPRRSRPRPRRDHGRRGARAPAGAGRRRDTDRCRAILEHQDHRPRGLGPGPSDRARVATGLTSQLRLQFSETRSLAATLSPTFMSCSVSFDAWKSWVVPSPVLIVTLP